MKTIDFSASFPTIAMSLLLLGIAAGIGYVSWRRNQNRRYVASLESLRMIVIALVVVTLWQPELLRQWNWNQQPEVAVLIDASGSMITKDVVQGGRATTRKDWVKQQREKQFWGTLTNQYAVVVEEFSGGGDEESTSRSREDEGTDINAALEAALLKHRRLRAVVLLSDGDWNTGKSPVAAATRLRVRDVPVYAIAVGSKEYLPDLVIERIAAPAYGLLGEQVFVGFTAKSFLPREVRTVVTLRDAWGAESAKEITIPAMGQVQDALFWTPLREGATTLTLSLPAEKEEVRDDNNRQVVPITIRKEILKVLVIDSTPRWEYRYLRNALQRDPGVDVETLLMHPGMPVGGGRGYLEAFPKGKDELSQYDVVFVGDVGVGQDELSLEAAEMLKGLVEQQGSGLVFLPGQRGRQASLLSTPLAELLPVEMDPSTPNGFGAATPSHLSLTERGRGHLLTTLTSGEEQNAQLWRLLPGFYWHAAVRKSKPGADVLAVHEGLRNQWGRIPLLVTRPHGNGKVLFMGIDSAWRWRAGVEDTYHYRFWGQVVRWMSYQRHLAQDRGFRVFYTPEDPHRGDRVQLHATVFDPSGTPLPAGKVSAEIVTPDGKSERLDLAPLEGGWGLFEGQFVPQTTGAFKVRVHNEETKQTIEADMLVSGEEREQVGRPAQTEILKEIASITQGDLGQPADIARFVKKISALPEANSTEQRLRLWCHPGWGGLIVLLLAVYWVGRKMGGMV